MDKKIIPNSIKKDKKTFELFERVEHYMEVMFGLATMFHFRELTKTNKDLSDEELEKLKIVAEDQARFDMLVLFERMIRDIK